MADKTLISEMGEWLVDQALGEPDIVAMFEAVCLRLYAAGVPLARARVIWPTLHPLFQAETVLWKRGSGAELTQFPHQVERAEEFLKAPVYFMMQNDVRVLRRRLEGPDKQLDFPVLEDLAAEGMTDYLTVVTGVLSDRIESARDFGLLVAWSSDRTGGFSDDDAEALQKIQRRFAVACKTVIQARIAGNIVETYLGNHAGHQVLDGVIKRGDGQATRAVVWYSDLHDATALADTMQPDDYLALLADYYECSASAVISHGGEVLDFIGSGVLAVFPFETARERTAAARAATAALNTAKINTQEKNGERVQAGLVPIRFGVGVNAGKVLFGNIGVENRLTFSVIGPTVNEVVRIEALTRDSAATALVTADNRRRRSQPMAFHRTAQARRRHPGNRAVRAAGQKQPPGRRPIGYANRHHGRTAELISALAVRLIRSESLVSARRKLHVGNDPTAGLACGAGRRSGAGRTDRPPADAGCQMVLPPTPEPRHRRTQHPPAIEDPPLRPDPAASTDRPRRSRSRCGAGRGKPCAGARHADRSRHGRGNTLCPRNRAGVQRLCLFPYRHPACALAGNGALPGASRLFRFRCADRDQAGFGRSSSS